MLASSQVHIAPLVTTDSSKSSMRIPVQLLLCEKNIDTQALLDSGAQGQFINQRFVTAHHIPTFQLNKPIRPLNVDGTVNNNGTINQYVWLKDFRVNNINVPAQFLVTNLGKESIICGLPWLKRTNSVANYQKGTLEFSSPPQLHWTIK